MKRIIEARRSIIVAADVIDLNTLEELVENVRDVPGIGAFKLGSLLGLCNLDNAVTIIKDAMGADFPVIYDHQKGGTDIPEMGASFAKAMGWSGVDAVILFPLTGPKTQEVWTEACFKEGLAVLTGGMMTHTGFLDCEGGYISNGAPERIYRFACNLGVRHFVVPGTKVDWVKKVREWLEEELGEGEYALYAPGLISQGGSVTECGNVAGGEWHAIVGRGIYEQPTAAKMHEAALSVTREIFCGK